MNALSTLAALAVVASCSAPNEGVETASESAATPMTASSLHDFTLKNIEGKEVPLKNYKGKTVLIVNVASRCGLTPQYKALQKLYTEHKDQGLVVLGFPANDFGNQEPGTNEEIKEFCSLNYGVTFPMFEKVAVNGDGASPLYKWLTANSDPKGPIEWNFAKFLIGPDGKILKRFKPQVTPDNEELVSAVKAALPKKG